MTGTRPVPRPSHRPVPPHPAPSLSWSARLAQVIDKANRVVAHLPVRLAVAFITIAVLYLLWCLATHRRVRGILRRLAGSAIAGAVLAGAGVAWVAVARHAKVEATATATKTPVAETLATAWGAGTVAGTVVFFLLSSWFVRARSFGRFAWLDRFSRRRVVVPAGRFGPPPRPGQGRRPAPGQMPGGPPGGPFRPPGGGGGQWPDSDPGMPPGLGGWPV